MGEPVLDLSEIIDLYKEDARRMVGEMQAALDRWSEVEQGGKACQDLRRLSHQLRGSGRTYGFCGVTRVGKAMEHVVQKLQEHRVNADDRTRKALQVKIKCLGAIFGLGDHLNGTH